MNNASLSAQLRRGVLGPSILALLSRGPRFGLELVREFELTGGLISSQGTIYPLLARLEESRFVRSYWEIAANGRPRRYYTLTELGQRELADFRVEWSRFSILVEEVLTEEKPKSSRRKK